MKKVVILLVILFLAQCRKPLTQENKVYQPEYPGDIPFVIGAKNIIQSEGGPSDEDLKLSYTTRLPVEEVLDYYQQALEIQGWLIKYCALLHDGLIVAKKPHTKVCIIVKEADNGSSIDIYHYNSSL